MYGLFTQWAAVTTHLELIKAPPQKWERLVSPYLFCKEICHVTSPTRYRQKKNSKINIFKKEEQKGRKETKRENNFN